MCDLILLNGITTSSWYAELAFRRRVSMSAMGSVMVMTASGPFSPRFPGLRSVPGSRPSKGAALETTAGRDLQRSYLAILGPRSAYQLLLVTPGSSPACAITRRHTRHRPNLRYTECG